ncbi:multidrug resistance-associated protein 5 [Tanacetum coccineum]
MTRPVSTIGGQGLILFKSTGGVPIRLSVCNPFTGQFGHLPHLQKSRTNLAVGVRDDFTNHFKLYVAGGMSEAANGGAASYEPKLEVFNSKSNKWTVMGSMPVEFAVRLTQQASYPTVSCFSLTGFLVVCIMGYEMDRDKWKELGVPMGYTLEFATLVPCDGKVAVVGGTHDGNVLLLLSRMSLQDDDFGVAHLELKFLTDFCKDTSLQMIGKELLMHWLGDDADESVDLFSNCLNLENLVIESSSIRAKNLTVIKSSINNIKPPLRLSYLRYSGYFYPKWFENCFHSLNEVSVSLSHTQQGHAARKTINMLQELRSARCLILNKDIVECISSFPDLLSHLPSPVSNLISLNITSNMRNEHKVKLSAEARNFLSRELSKCHAEMEVEKPDDVVTSTSNIDKGIDATDSVEARTSTTDKQGDDDSDYQSDKSADYLSPGEEELIELRNRMTTNKEAKAKPKDNPVSEMNEPNNKNSMPTNNVRGETFEEHDIYMNLLLKSLNTADKDGITEDPFIFVKKHVERYPMYDKTTDWRLRKPKVGEKYISVTQFKECRTYYALENGFSLWYEMSGKVRVVSKCGQRTLRLSDPEKVVNVENKDNWTWFLELLEQDLGSSRGNGLTLMSDQHKGLIEVVKDVMPNAEHRQCARHIYCGKLEGGLNSLPLFKFKVLKCL